MSNETPLSDGSSLMDALIQPRISVDAIADKWVENYKNDENESLLSLISFIFESCGCKPSITLATLEEGGWMNLVNEIEERVPSSGLSKYPIIEERNKLGKKFSKNLCGFIGKILLKIQQEILYDGYILPHLCSLLHMLSKSSLRAFRHTATLIVVKITSTMAEIMRALVSQYSKLDKQLSSEKCKRSNKKSIDRVEVLESSLAKLVEQISEIDDRIIFLTNTILPHRFRDVYNLIRIVCMEELELWLLNYPKAFMKMEYLKYLGWALGDPVATVRLNCLQTLKLILSNCKLTEEMLLFTSNIKNRIITMSLDKSYAVSAVAIHVVLLIFRCIPDIIGPEDKSEVLYLVYSHDKEVAKAAGAFLHECIIDAVKDRSNSHKRFSSLCLLQLKDFVIDSKGMEQVPLLIDALLSQPQVEYLTDWTCYSEILLADESTSEEHRYQESAHNTEISASDTAERVLISLMANSVKQVVLNESPRKTRLDKKLLSKKVQKRNTEEMKVSIKHLLDFLPKLMKKYMPEPHIITDILSVCLMINVSFISKHQDIYKLVSSLMEVPGKHVDLEVHLACAKAMAHLCSGGSSTATFCSSTYLGPYLQQIVLNWRKSLAEYSQMCSRKKDLNLILEENDLIFTIEKNSRSLWAVSCYFSLEDQLDWEELYTLCKGTVLDEKGRHSPVTCEVMRNSLKTAMVYIFWEDKDKDKEDLLKYHVDDFFLVGEHILKSTSEIDYTVRNTAYFCLSEMMCILFKSSLLSSETWKSSMQSALNRLLQNFLAVVSSKDGFEDMSEKEKVDTVKNHCSLILRGAMPPEAAIYFLKNLKNELIFQSWSFIEMTISVIQSWDMENFALIILDTLTSTYAEITEKDDDLKSESLSELIILAKQLNNMYGSNIGRQRKATVRLHLKGLHFAFEVKQNNADPLPQIQFAQVLKVFSPLVHQNDQRKLSQYLNDHVEAVKTKLQSLSPELNQSWSVLKEYESSLSSSKRLSNTDKNPKLSKKKKLLSD